ncbi:tyrosine-type recombinase/integrase [Arthrobacter psychrochitiniphilus]|uniref:Integrase n=1 Tax=Arthrobacter psychrochitiniphilus TaxID=291045 RepID=A0A2V3DMQ8_9MICC|nr:tyrosine-type recombinase/integrase [Arthrobacter psychrochitiniphilus]NYG18033.1 integrase [Arthrobacter psychrochitiniphilus]PXA64243.1 integrase [Arthrobacter psychrochitiniphilus]
MDTTVAAIGIAVVAALEDAGYMHSTIGQVRKSIKWLGVLAQKQDGLYTIGLGAEFASMTTSPRTGKYSAQRHTDYSRLAWLFDSFVLTGIVDVSTRPSGRHWKQPNSAEFSGLLDAFSQDMEQRGLTRSTKNSCGLLACEYLNFLEVGGTFSWEDADGASVLGFPESIRDRWAESSMWSAVASFRPFLKFTARTDLLDALALARARRHHKIIPVLDSGVQEKVVNACQQGVVSARDAAIVLLSLLTGLRACDICGLQLADIGWRGGTIGIVQQKTGNPLTLPLPALVVAKLARYVLGERPVSDAKEVFLRLKAPHSALADHASIYVIINKVFRASGVEDVKVGSRALRYNAASKLLWAGTALPTISAILGHAHSDSTNVYLNADTERLLACVLPLPEGAR